eukprot:gene27407-34119_t
MAYGDLDIHQTVCKERPVTCGCGTLTTATRILTHQIVDCSLVFAECPLQRIAMCEVKTCTGYVKHAELDAHVGGNIAQITKLVQVITTTREQLALATTTPAAQKQSRSAVGRESNYTENYKALEEGLVSEATATVILEGYNATKTPPPAAQYDYQRGPVITIGGRDFAKGTCFMYHKNGDCRNGSSCKYSH